MTRFLLVLALASLTGCASRAHLQYDHGRAYLATTAAQADLSRAAAEESAYPLTGEEGLELRQRVVESSTDTETGQAEAVDSITVQ
jgi:hypothetical protein